MADSTDILLKAAEDVSSGMWCSGAMFKHEGEIGGETWVPDYDVDLDRVLQLRRCALGSIAVATAQLGGDSRDYETACERAATWIEPGPDPFDIPGLADNGEARIAWFNDTQLPDDAFEAGSILADLFRRAAEAV